MSRNEILTRIAIGVVSSLLVIVITVLYKSVNEWRKRRKEAKSKEVYLPRERCYTKEERKAIEQRTKEIAAEIEAQLNKER